ncbi:unnamed protein product [Ceratitis capitata]|uniref:(Mediterranean fruit fly) hypothetical protein n=1 Tax=Ceratitis capitata TaxID=7213 RepID=A0A811VI01_CERCA|nr:unnamed protein product [Ceratitis capitata]
MTTLVDWPYSDMTSKSAEDRKLSKKVNLYHDRFKNDNLEHTSAAGRRIKVLYTAFGGKNQDEHHKSMELLHKNVIRLQSDTQPGLSRARSYLTFFFIHLLRLLSSSYRTPWFLDATV